MKKINITEKFKLFNEYWSPRVVGELNGQFIKLAKFKGEFIWHSHTNEDELFWVVKGTLRIEFRDGFVTLNEGEFYIVPKGVEHKPIAEDEAHVMLLEPKSTKQTGGIECNLLVDNQPWI
jgi:mannose-6-phosphate isomerase-like protein (cupin superfamily)